MIHETYIDYWDFGQSGGPASQASPYQVHKGDSFRTICYYGSESETKFGFGSQDEMCITFILYYPKQYFPICGLGLEAFPPCNGSYDGGVHLSSQEDIGRVFAPTPSKLPTADPSGSSTSNNIQFSVFSASVLALFTVVFFS